MKLGAKIVLGFVATNAIYIALSVFIFISAQPVREDAKSLSRDFLPVLDQASQIQYSVAMEGYKITDYSHTIKAETMVEALTFSADVVKYLWRLDETIKNSPALKSAGIGEAVAALRDDYQKFRKAADLLPPQLNQVNTNLESIIYGQEAFNKNLAAMLEHEQNSYNAAAARGASPDEMAGRLKRMDEIRGMESLGNSLVVGAITARYTNKLGEFEACRAYGGQIMGLVGELEASASDDQSRQYVAKAKELLAIAGGAVDKLETTLKAANDGTAERDRLADNVIKYSVTLREKAEALAQNVAGNASGTLDTVIVSLIGGVALALVLSLVLSYLITRGITRPVNALITRLSEGAQEVDRAAGELSGSSNSLAAGAKDNASSLEEVSAALEELSSMTGRNADNSVEANSLMSQAEGEVGAASDSMGRVITAMEEIESSGNEIAKIIKTIDEIAFQTNLLALNAAVEAARAGEAGAGFAVVADEVRNLATRSAEAARNTADLIDATISNINIGSQMVQQTADNFRQVGERTGKVAQLVGEVAEASKEQSIGINQINDSMTAMDKVTQNNAMSADQSASAAESLSSQAAMLLSAVDDLGRLTHGGQGGLPPAPRPVGRPGKFPA